MISEESLRQLEYFKVLESIAEYAITEYGKVVIAGVRPSADYELINKRGTFINEAKNILIQSYIPPINYIRDSRRDLTISSIEGTVLSANQIKDILTLAEISRHMYSFLRSNAGESSLFTEYSEGLFVDKVFEHQISNVFTDSGEIKDSASTELRDIRKKIIEKNNLLRKLVNRILKQFSEAFLVQEEYVTLRDGRIVLPVKAEHKRHVKGFIHSESATGQTVYIEPEETLEMNNEVTSLHFAEKREIERILKSLTAKIGGESQRLKYSLETIGELDSIFAAAKYSVEIIGAFPSFSESGAFELINTRHPVLIRKLGRDLAVPLNFKLKNNKIVVITGPNAGGKTVVLKTIGLLAAMCLSGFHIPVDVDSNFRIFNNILIDIGDHQSIEDDLSTFSSHLKSINNILSIAQKDSLVLLDEVGTGTDPAEGSALATAVLIKLRDIGASCFATTHHGNLKLIANDLENFENASMLFNTEKLEPTFIFSLGTPGSSYAFEVAIRTGLDDSVIELAKTYMDSNKNKVEELLVDLERKSNKLKEKINYYETENSRLNGLTELYSEKISKLEKEKKEIIAKTRIEADNYLKNVNRKVESTIKKIRESKAEKSVVRVEREKIEDLKIKNDIIAKEQEAQEIVNENLAVGEYARINSTDTIGKITDINNDIAILQSGNVKLKVKLNNLVREKGRRENKVQSQFSSFTTSLPSLRLDIRGRKPEEAEYEVLKYIDDAYSASTPRVEILHGKGTGVLKEMVHEILKKHNAVKEYHFAKIEVGGEGITIVELN